jgi:phage-related minor tail protein
MSDGVAKWASEHNKQLNYLTLAQYSYIKSLEEQGKVEQAEIENLKALSEHLGGPMVQNLGYLERSLHAVRPRGTRSGMPPSTSAARRRSRTGSRS